MSDLTEHLRDREVLALRVALAEVGEHVKVLEAENKRLWELVALMSVPPAGSVIN